MYLTVRSMEPCMFPGYIYIPICCLCAYVIVRVWARSHCNELPNRKFCGPPTNSYALLIISFLTGFGFVFTSLPACQYCSISCHKTALTCHSLRPGRPLVPGTVRQETLAADTGFLHGSLLSCDVMGFVCWKLKGQDKALDALVYLVCNNVYVTGWSKWIQVFVFFFQQNTALQCLDHFYPLFSAFNPLAGGV